MLKIISLIFNFVFLLGMAVFCFPATAVKAYELKDETRGLGVPDVVAKVNGVDLKSKIIKFQFNRTMRDMDRKVDAREKKKLIQMLIDKEVVRELIHHEGKRKNLVIAQEDINKELEKMRMAYGYKSNDELAKALKERDIALDELKQTIKIDLMARNLLDKKIRGKIRITDAQVKKFYDDNKSQFHRPESFRVQHIFIPHVSAEAVITLSQEELMKKKDEFSKEAEKKIDEIYRKIKPGTDFGKMARKYSEDEGSAEKGGDLDFMYQGVFDPEFDEAVSKLQPGEVSPVVKTSFGYHIIKLNEVRPSEMAPFEEVEASIQKRLFSEEAKAKVQNYIAGLRKKADIKMFY